MADTVRYHTEEMVPELQDLERRGFFNAPELKRIAAKRTDFEYLLKRRAALKADYLRYIDYEKQVEALRLMRRKSRRLGGKASLADYAGVRRIHFIFERACRKFAGDLRMWTFWLQYCQESGSSRRISRVLTKALQLHPNEEGLWSRAAAWELQHNGNAAAARALMQRGLRMSRNSPHLWLEYFRMELTYSHRLRTRRRVLGLDDHEAERPAGAEQEIDDEQRQEAEQAEAAVQAVLSGGIARVVYRNAVAAVPRDVAFRQKFLTALRKFQFPGVEALEEDIHTSITADFAGSPAAVDVAARRLPGHHADPDQIKAASKLYEQALRERPSAELYDLYAAFLTEQLQQQLDAKTDAADAGEADAATQAGSSGCAIAEQLLSVYQKASDAGCASEEALLAWPTLALRCGRADSGLSAAVAGAAARPTSAVLQRQALVLHVQHLFLQASTAVSEGERKQLITQLQQAALDAVAGLSGDSAALVWLTALEALIAADISITPLLDSLATTLLGSAKGPLQGGMGEVAAAAVEAAHETQGLAASRRLWRQLATGPPPGGDFYLAAARVEAAAVMVEDPAADFTAAKAAFEAGVAAYGFESDSLWLEYVRFAQMASTAGVSSGDLFRRASRALDDPLAFMHAFKQLQGL